MGDIGMTSIRNLFYLVLAAALTAFALPASAATKQISLTVTAPAQPFTASTTQITLTLSNDGNSNGNSYEIDWLETPNFHVVSGTVGGVAGTPVNPGVWAPSTGKPYQGLVWNKTAPAKTTITIVLNVQITVTCTSVSTSFAAAMWTGSPGPLSTSFPMPSGPIPGAIASLPNCISCNPADQSTAVFPPVAGTTGYFANLPAGVSMVTQPGFAAGYRFNNDKGDMCKLVDYTFTNNITGSGNFTDANNNTFPPNSASLLWNLPLQPNAVFVYQLTYQPEYVGADGLPVKKTKFCILSSGGTDCTVPANQATLQACIGTAFTSTSIPGSDPACIMQEVWTTVPGSDCVNAGVPNPNGQNPAPACVRATDTILDARDPGVIRG